MNVFDVGQWIREASRFGDPGTLSWFQMDCMAEHRTRADQPVTFVCIQIIARLGVEVVDPGNLVDLFAEVRLHQTVRVFRPKCAEGGQLVW